MGSVRPGRYGSHHVAPAPALPTLAPLTESSSSMAVPGAVSGGRYPAAPAFSTAPPAVPTNSAPQATPPAPSLPTQGGSMQNRSTLPPVPQNVPQTSGHAFPYQSMAPSTSSRYRGASVRSSALPLRTAVQAQPITAAPSARESGLRLPPATPLRPAMETQPSPGIQPGQLAAPKLVRPPGLRIPAGYHQLDRTPIRPQTNAAPLLPSPISR